MVSGNWLNSDNLYLQYGTSKATAETAGEFRSGGENRVFEFLLDLTTLTATAAIQSNTALFPSGTGIFIESVSATVETGAASGTTFSVGLMQLDRTTIPANYSTAFINAEITAAMDTAGKKVTYINGTSKAGGLIGSTAAAATGPYYVTALSSGTYTTGKIRVRINYHGIGTISQ